MIILCFSSVGYFSSGTAACKCITYENVILPSLPACNFPPPLSRQGCLTSMSSNTKFSTRKSATLSASAVTRAAAADTERSARVATGRRRRKLLTGLGITCTRCSVHFDRRRSNFEVSWRNARKIFFFFPPPRYMPCVGPKCALRFRLTVDPSFSFSRSLLSLLPKNPGMFLSAPMNVPCFLNPRPTNGDCCYAFRSRKKISFFFRL